VTLDDALDLAWNIQGLGRNEPRPEPEEALAILRGELLDCIDDWPEGEEAIGVLVAHLCQPPPPPANPRFRVGLYVDEMASLMSAADEEYADLEKELTRSVFGPEPVRFTRGVPPWEYSGHQFDLYCVDFGGMAAQSFGSRSFIYRYVDTLIRVIADNPSTYFLLWSNFTVKYMQEGYWEMFGIDNDWSEQLWPPNVIRYPEGYDEVQAVWPRLRALLGIQESR
jgi:hypothetical protein